MQGHCGNSTCKPKQGKVTEALTVWHMGMLREAKNEADPVLEAGEVVDERYEHFGSLQIEQGQYHWSLLQV